MKRISVVSTGVLLLLLGAAAPTYAQQGKQEEKGKPAQQQPQGQARQGQTKQPQQRAQQQPQAQTKQPQQRAQQQPQGQTRQQPQQRAQQQPQGQTRQQPQQRAQQQPQGNRPSQQGQRVQQPEQRGMWQQHRASNWQVDHRSWQQRGGYNGYRIPDVRFRSYFGRGHGFHIFGLPFMTVGGNPRFLYNGYWVSILDPWPEYWADNWYETDDVYIDYSGGGYYLYDLRYPGVPIAVSVSLN